MGRGSLPARPSPPTRSRPQSPPVFACRPGHARGFFPLALHFRAQRHCVAIVNARRLIFFFRRGARFRADAAAAVAGLTPGVFRVRGDDALVADIMHRIEIGDSTVFGGSAGPEQEAMNEQASREQPGTACVAYQP